MVIASEVKLESQQFRCPEIPGVEEFKEFEYDKFRGLMHMYASVGTEGGKERGGVITVRYGPPDPESSEPQTRESEVKELEPEQAPVVFESRVRSGFGHLGGNDCDF
ncbi:hypothetical protein SISNIDRAFT_490891 [Sistotremastrum niveocremeum HHB9708]|uniref:Uncharacterized protein n=1 Tax=Sistotremastrum niveocremeum HHB9708 TaxID=1314777 RepID=A0A164NFA4_9AGAM|nr:hypothetical protein SISNIDRAFT_490891 [Sistotremastrum niveocremeum HHB9708]